MVQLMKLRMFKKKRLVVVWEERSGQGRRHHLENTFTYNYVCHRGSNALLYNKIKEYVMTLCGKEPTRRHFLYF